MLYFRKSFGSKTPFYTDFSLGNTLWERQLSCRSEADAYGGLCWNRQESSWNFSESIRVPLLSLPYATDQPSPSSHTASRHCSCPSLSHILVPLSDFMLVSFHFIVGPFKSENWLNIQASQETHGNPGALHNAWHIAHVPCGQGGRGAGGRWQCGPWEERSLSQFQRRKRCRFNPWVRKIPWSRKWQSIPVFLPGKFHGQRSLVCYSPWVTKSQTQLSKSACTHTRTYTHTHSPSSIVGLWVYDNSLSLISSWTQTRLKAFALASSWDWRRTLMRWGQTQLESGKS